ncbi:MAG TPA: MFS transporter [Nevskiaceae bacterium]|nr:MFS transporter [Nevskiaceae bacterium]
MFSLPAVLQGFMHTPAQSLVQGIYAKHAGLSLAALASAVIVTRVFDAVIDPVIGIAADAWRRRTSTHKHFLAFGTLVTILGLWQLYRPPVSVSIAYFTGWFMVAYLGWTITEIPYRAWSIELSSEYTMRTRIQTWLGVATAVGTYAFFFVPLLGKSLGLTQSTEIDLSTLALGAIVIAAVMPLANLIAIWRVPDGAFAAREDQVHWSELWQAVRQNGPLLYFMLMFLAAGITLAISTGVSYLFFDALGLSDKLAALSLLLAPVTLIGMPVWAAVCKRFDRQKVWALCLLATSACYVLYGLVPPGESGLMIVGSVSMLLLFFSTCSFVVAPATLGDIVDYGRWKLGHDHSSFYVAFFALIQKAINGVGIAIGFMLLDLLGFDAAAKTHSASDLFAIRLTSAWLPAAAILIAAPFVWRFPITRAKHEQMLREIAARDGNAR